MRKEPRDYQQAAIESPFKWFVQGNTGYPVIVAPVGSGKSLIQAEIAAKLLGLNHRNRILCLVHTEDLVGQNYAEMMGQYPESNAGIYCAALGVKRTHNDITFATIQSIAGKLHLLNRHPDVIMVDEVHLISRKDESQYRAFIDQCKALNPNLVVVGLTGTPYRPDSGMLWEGENALFSGCCYEIPLRWMIDEGWLCRPRTPSTTTRLSTDGVARRGGDYVESQLQRAVDTDEQTRACVAEAIAHIQLENRRKIMVFAAGVEHAKNIAAEFNAQGIEARYVIGGGNSKDKAERKTATAWFKRPADKPKVLVNVACLTTGFNVPDVDCIVLMRPTQSPVLYIQIVGRGIRPVYAAGMPLDTPEQRLAAIAASIKPDCLLIDFGRVVETLGPIDSIVVKSRSKKKGESALEVESKQIVKNCPKCGTECAPSQKYCYNCLYDFVAAKLDYQASNAAVLSADSEPREVNVIHMELRKHCAIPKTEADKLKPPTLKVTYYCLDGKYYDFLGFDHPKGSYPRDRARYWHNLLMPDEDIPGSIDEALKIKYPRPKTITVQREGQYWRVRRISAPEQEEVFEEIAF